MTHELPPEPSPADATAAGVAVEPLVSVILASYNHAAFVAEAVKSVLEQTCSDLELIVVDDASTDATPDIVAEMQDARLRLIRSPFNRAFQKRNLALGMARGRYIAFQNSDDVWMPGKLAAQIDVLETAGSMVCFTAVEIIDEAGAIASDTWANGIFTTNNRPRAAWLHKLYRGNCFALPSAMIRRADLERTGGFAGSMVQLSDYDLWVRIAAGGGEFTILPAPLTRLRVVEGVNLSAPSPRGRRRSAIELADVLAHFVEPDVLAQFPMIFPELSDPGSSGARKVMLAEHAAKRRGQGGLLFADRTIARVLENREERAQAVDALGADFIKRFLNRRCEMEIRLMPEKPASRA